MAKQLGFLHRATYIVRPKPDANGISPYRFAMYDTMDGLFKSAKGPIRHTDLRECYGPINTDSVADALIRGGVLAEMEAAESILKLLKTVDPESGLNDASVESRVREIYRKLDKYEQKFGPLE